MDLLCYLIPILHKPRVTVSIKISASELGMKLNERKTYLTHARPWIQLEEKERKGERKRKVRRGGGGPQNLASGKRPMTK